MAFWEASDWDSVRIVGNPEATPRGVSLVQKDEVFAQFLPWRKRTVESVDYSMASVAISTHRVFRLADVHGQVMRYFPKPTSCY